MVPFLTRNVKQPKLWKLSFVLSNQLTVTGMKKLLINLNESFTFQHTWSWHWLVHAVVWDLHSSCPVFFYLLLMVVQCDPSVSWQGGSIVRQSRIAVFRPFRPLQDLYFNRTLRSLLHENYKIILKWDVKLGKRYLLHVISVAIIPVSRSWKNDPKLLYVTSFSNLIFILTLLSVMVLLEDRTGARALGCLGYLPK